MKFLCDRCKTRYSIGDERVRGKILKIRCKNCANVITVREGMTDADASGAAPRRTKTTTAAPIVNEQPAGNGASALGAAFASAMTKPPPALDEEWYVSIDGEQSGPFSLAEAQRWVATKAFDADLHCWSEGFDDWLPVDKVSHFRGLRKKPPPPAAPPPIPPSRTGPARAITAAPSRAVQAAAMTAQQQPEEEPKPLFAATMASLERSAPTAANGANGARATAGAGVAGSANVANGTAARPAMQVPSIPSALPSIKPSPTVKGVGLRPVGAPAKPLGFDPSEGAATQIESPAFPSEDQPTMRPESSPNGEAFVAALGAEKSKQRSLSSLLEAKPDPKGQTGPNDAFFDRVKAEPKPEPEPDDLEIGEVSRVVNLADLARSKPAAKEKVGNRTGSVQKLTGAVPKLNGASLSGKLNATAPVPLIDAVETIPTGQLADLPLAPIAPIVETSHRRGMIALMIGALVLLGAAVVVVVFVVNSRNEVTSLGSDYDYNGQRPEDPIHRPGDPPSGSNEPPVNPFLPPKPRLPPRPNPNLNPGSGKVQEPIPTGNSIKGDEVEAVARQSSGTTVACWRRADKGADAIRLADVKKISVFFHINADGTVQGNSIKLSESGSETLNGCLQRMMSGWKFRANAGTDFKFVFAKPE